MKKVLDKEVYKDIYEYTRKIQKSMNISEEIVINMYDSKYIDGHTKNSYSIGLSMPLLSFYEKNIEVVKLVICHELAHIKNNDTSFSSLMRRMKWDMFNTKKALAKSLLQELRADIEGSTYSQLSDEEIYSAHMIIDKFNSKFRTYTDYEYGYPIREKRAYYSIKYKELNADAKEEILNDYFSFMRIR
jgi:hypothetical protein